MRWRRQGRLSLTNRLLILAALIVVTTSVLLALTVAAGVYRMALDQQRTREAAYRDILTAEVGGRLDGAYRVVRATAETSGLATGTPEAARRTLMSTAIENAEYLEGLALVESPGTVVAAWPSGLAASGVPPAVATLDASPTVIPYVWDDSGGTPTAGTLWAVAAVPSEGGSARLLVARLRTTFIRDTLLRVSESVGSPVTVVFDGTGQPIYVSGDAASVEGAEYDFGPEAASGSQGELRTRGDNEYVGYYGDITALGDLGWRIGVLEPAARAMREVWAAVSPGVLGWVAALAIAIGIALFMVNRVTRPIRQLEGRALALAAGTPVAPEPVEQHDEIGRLLDAFNSVARRLDRLSATSELLAQASDRTLVLDGITTSIAHMLGDADVEVVMLTEDGRLEVVAAYGALAGREGFSVPAENLPHVSEALASGEPIALTAAAGDGFLAARGDSDNPAEVLVAPLRAGSDIIGAVGVVRPAGTPFSVAESETVRSFAAQASVALRNWRLFEEERRSRKEAEALRAVAERVASPVGIDATLKDVAAMEADLLGFDRSLVALRKRAAYGLPPADGADLESAWLSAWDQCIVEGGPRNEPCMVATDESPHHFRPLLLAAGAHSALLTPLVHGGASAGLLVLLADHERPSISDAYLALAGTVGRQASLALENAYLYEQARSRADNLETIFRISHAVGSSLQSRIVLNRVLDVVQKILSADAVMLMTYDTQRKIISVPMARGILHRDMLEISFRPGEDIPGRVFETREPERFDRIADTDTRLLNAAAEQGLVSLIVVPLLARGRSIGILAVFSRADAAFTSEDLDLLRTFASQAALAIDTAELFSREHHVATVLQESILPPSLPRIRGLEASSVYLPGGLEADIGGDYYDLFTAPDGRVVAAIGDVCGKGVVAATKTSMLKYAVRGMVVAGLGPARVLEELNRMLVEAGDPTSIVTLWIGYLDTSVGTLSYANAGHPPALLRYPSTGEIVRLATTGALLGAVADATWEQQDVHVEDGAALLMYTDGVTEARAGNRFFGEGRVRRVLRQGGTPTAIVQRLLGLVQHFAAGELRDDAAILVVARADATED